MEQRIAIWQNTLEFTCTWDLGRRCSLDCTYCPPYRHNSTSPHADFEKLKEVARLPLTYSKALRQNAAVYQSAQVSFTGGEPTLNPRFIELCKYLTEKDSTLRLGVTTNGLFSDGMAKELAHHLDFITLSYHCEADEKQKQRIHSAIKVLSQQAKDPSVRLSDFNINLMVHAHQDYFEECVRLSEQWAEIGVRFEKRAIGEHPNAKGAHKYTPEQMEFISGKRPNLSCDPQARSGKVDLGRKCCGGRPIKEIMGHDMFGCADIQKISQTPNADRIQNRNFKGWNCLVNLFFLHIEQETGQIYYHQTCQANQHGARGPIGKIEQMDDLINEIEGMFANKKVRAIICPNEICNCGLCITKAKDPEILKTFLKSSMPGFQLVEGASHV